MKKNTKTVDTKKAVAEVKEAVAEAKKTVAESAPVKKAAETVAEVKKAAPKKAAEVTAEVKKAAPRKPAAKKPEVKVVVQYAGKEISCQQMVEAAKAAWTGKTMKDVTFYVKPEESKVYFVVNGEPAGDFEF